MALVVCCSLVLNSCASYKWLRDWEEYAKLDGGVTNNIVGKYENKETSGSALLWTCLTWKPSAAQDMIQMEIAGRDKLRITRQCNGLPEETRVIGYRVRDKHISLSTQYHFPGPVFPLLWLWYRDDLYFGVTTEKELSVYCDWAGTSFVGPIPFFGAGHGEVYQYKRVKE